MNTYRVHYIKPNGKFYKRVVRANSIKEAQDSVGYRASVAVRINEVGAVIRD